MSPSLESSKTSTAVRPASHLECGPSSSHLPLEPTASQPSPDITLSESQVFDKPQPDSPPSRSPWWPLLLKALALGVGAIVLAAIGNFSSSSSDGLLQGASLGASLPTPLAAAETSRTSEWLDPGPASPARNGLAASWQSPAAEMGSSAAPQQSASQPAPAQRPTSGPREQVDSVQIGVVRVNGIPQKAEGIPEASRATPSSQRETREPESSNSERTGGVTPDGRVILNQANVQELTLLPGIGVKRAEQIVELRERLGGFKRISDLLRVRGIGSKSLRKLMPYLILNPPNQH